jgi:UDP-N-acetylglucosamine--N-acetylmuramyl-(pentapeptide) pyrophosphoryl-undecaprenol N-acetylglucosamine transferase
MLPSEDSSESNGDSNGANEATEGVIARLGPRSIRPRTTQPIRVVNYAVNGLGLGHLTRLIAINRHVRRLARLLGERTEITFVTSSEGDGLAYQHGFASFHIPSKTAVTVCDLDPHRYRKLAKQWLWNALSLSSPDIMLVDTFPGGSFGELYDVLDLGQRNVFVYREVREKMASTPAFQSALSLYDLFVLPNEFGENASPLPANARAEVCHTDQILIRSRDEVHDRSTARRILGLADDQTCVYVSTGGGGDIAAESSFRVAIEVAHAMPQVQFVFGAGLLYRGDEPWAPNVRWTRRPLMMELFAAFDAAVTSGGFNSIWELMHCGVPCAFTPQPRSHDDQERRAERCAAAGAGILVEEVNKDTITAALQQLLDPNRHQAYVEAARALITSNSARDAAEAVLSLVLPEEAVNEAGSLTSDAICWQAKQLGIDEGPLFDVAAHLWRHERTLGTPAYELDELLPESLTALKTAVAEGFTAQMFVRSVRQCVEPAPIPDVLKRALEHIRTLETLNPVHGA